MSSVPLYLNRIDLLASKLDDSVAYEHRLLKSWAEFESDCKSLVPEYDILRSDVGQWFLDKMALFVRLLYENGDSSPKADCDQIREKDAAYGGSWHSRGGTGAFHALARKGDRLVSMFKKFGTLEECRKDKTNSESIDDTLGDLRRYLILVLAWHEARKAELEPIVAALKPRECECGHGETYHTDVDFGCTYRIEELVQGYKLCSCLKFIAVRLPHPRHD